MIESKDFIANGHGIARLLAEHGIKHVFGNPMGIL